MSKVGTAVALAKVSSKAADVVPGEETDGAVTKTKRAFIDAVALAAIGSGIATLVLTTGSLVTTAAYCTIGFGPFASLQKRKLAKLGGFRYQHNRLRGEVNELSEENNKLTQNVDELEKSVDKLEEVEGQLAELAGDRANADRLVACVKKNQELLDEIKQNLENRVIHDIMTVLMRADRNNDFTIGPNELNMIIFSLNNIDGIEFNETLFRELLSTHGEKHGDDGVHKIDGAMRVIRNILDPDDPEEYNVFNIRTEQLAEKLKQAK